MTRGEALGTFEKSNKTPNINNRVERNTMYT